MTKTESLKNLVKISNKIGENLGFIQVGGGNTSVKFGPRSMAVKSSGSLLSDMTVGNGYCVVDYRSINDYLNNPDDNEDEFVLKIRSLVIETNNRPSMETGFHSILGKFVLHTHSVYTNVITCCSEGKSISKKLLPSSTWVNYHSPGKELILAVQAKIKSDIKKTQIIFLQNHGIIISASNPEEVIDVHSQVNKEAMDFLNLDEFGVLEDLEKIPKQNILFPDQVVYTLSDISLLQTEGAKEIMSAYSYILRGIEKNSLSPRFLSKQEVSTIQEMESEKFRQEVFKNDVN